MRMTIDGVGLYRTTDTKRGQCREDGEEDGEPFHVQPALQGIHRTAVGMTVASLYAVFHGQQSFGVFGGHAKDTCEPAPQYGTGTAQGHCGSHTDDISRSDGGCQGRGQGTELTDIAFGSRVFPDRETDACE